MVEKLNKYGQEGDWNQLYNPILAVLNEPKETTPDGAIVRFWYVNYDFMKPELLPIVRPGETRGLNDVIVGPIGNPDGMMAMLGSEDNTSAMWKAPPVAGPLHAPLLFIEKKKATDATEDTYKQALAYGCVCKHWYNSVGLGEAVVHAVHLEGSKVQCHMPCLSMTNLLPGQNLSN